MLFFPKMYQKSIYDINYQKLYTKGIRLLLFDLDNTVGLLEEEVANEKTKKLFRNLHKQFEIVIISNNTNKSRVSFFAQSLECDYFYFSMKPSIRCFKQVAVKYHMSKDKICMIGDQLMTDILAANRYKICSCLVDAMSQKDLKITSFNRMLEKIVWMQYEKKKIMKKGRYYE